MVDTLRSFLVAKNFMRGVLAVLFVLFGIYYLNNITYTPIPAANRDIVMVCLGFVIANLNTIYGFFFGTSQSSSDKGDVINSKLNP